MKPERDREKDMFQNLASNRRTKAESKKLSRKLTRQGGSKGDEPKVEQPMDTEPKYGLDAVAGMEETKRLFREAMINVLENPECASAFGLRPPSVLLYGPPGCGKTFFVEKLAEETGLTFYKITPDDIASIYVHGTQQKIGEYFNRMEANAPCLAFFDEFDAMVPKRDDRDESNGQNGEVNEFLCRLNNAAEKGIYVIAATNRPTIIDQSILRTGRIDERIYVGMPDEKAREALFRLELSKLPAAADIDYQKLANMTEGYNCSDISYIVKVASRQMFNVSIKDKTKNVMMINQPQLETIIANKTPSVSSRDIKAYERIRGEFSPKETGCQPQTIGFH